MVSRGGEKGGRGGGGEGQAVGLHIVIGGGAESKKLTVLMMLEIALILCLPELSAIPSNVINIAMYCCPCPISVMI